MARILCPTRRRDFGRRESGAGEEESVANLVEERPAAISDA